MKCPVCGKKSSVFDSRYENDYVRRRRFCPECHERFTTYEMSVYRLSSIMEKLFARELIAKAGLAAGEAVSRTLRRAVLGMDEVRQILKEENSDE